MTDELYYTPEYFKNVLCQHHLVEGVRGHAEAVRMVNGALDD